MGRDLGRRLRFVARFARSAHSWRDLSGACILGVARGSPFAGTKLISSLGRHLFPSVCLRPRRLNGERVWIETCDLGQLISYEEILVDGTYDLGLVSFQPSAIVDCGSHVGLFARLAAVRFPNAQLVAFEPDPDNCVYLARQFKSLGNRVRLRKAAVSLADGTGWFEADQSNTGRLTEERSARGRRVAIVDFRRELHPFRGQPLLLKLDIEGSEEQVLPGCLPVLPQTAAIFLETHRGPDLRERLNQMLEEHGFSVRWLRVREPYADGFAWRH